MPVGTDIIAGLFTSIVYDSLKRPFKGMAEIATRRRNINRALAISTTVDTQETATKREAIKDLVRVLGNDHNAHSDAIADFLQDVERSAIPDALKHFALCGHDAEGAFPAFEVLYTTHTELPFTARALFDALNAAITTRINQAVEEKMLFEALRAQHEELATQITALSSSLRNAGGIEEPIGHKDFEELREKIARGIENTCRQINVETTQGTRKVNIKKLVIAARLDYISDKAGVPSPHREAEADRSQAASYLHFRRSFNRAVILGDPGGGKSTLTQLLCFDLARQISLAAANPKYGGFDSRDMRLPLRIILRTFEKRQQQNPSYQIFDYLIDEIRVYCDNDENLAVRFIKQILAFGQTCLLFDGLDEVLDVASRRTVATVIEQFMAAHASCPALVTSRIVGYGDAPLSDDYQISTLARFNAEEVKKFSEQLIRAISSEKVNIAKEKAAEFLTQTDNTAGDLRENPLLLGLMVYIFNARGEVPSSRPEIYKECSILMFEKWDQRRDIRFEFPQDFDLLDLFGFLATQIFGSADTEDGVSEEWLVEKLRIYFNVWYQDKVRSFGAAKVLVEFITGRAWVMCEIGPGVFKFTHRTFLEYFFAKRIEEEAGSVNSLIHGSLFAKIVQSQWDVVNHLALQIATFRSGPKSLQAVDSLLQRGTSSHLAPEEEVNFLSFFARSLDYLLVPEARLADAVEHIFVRTVHLGGNYSLNVTAVLRDLLEATYRRGTVASDRLSSLAVPILSGSSSPERTFLLYVLGSRYIAYRTNRRGQQYSNLVWHSFRKLRIDAKTEQHNRALHDISEARDYIYVYGDSLQYLYEIHGPGLLFCAASGLIPVEISHLGYLVVHEAIRLQTSGAGPRFFDFELPKDESLNVMLQLSETLLAAWRQGSVGEIVPSQSENVRFGVLDELSHYLFYLATKRKSMSFKILLSRAAFSYVVMGGAYRSKEQFDRLVRFRRLRGKDVVASASLVASEKDDFSSAIREISKSFGTDIGEKLI